MWRPAGIAVARQRGSAGSRSAGPPPAYVSILRSEPGGKSGGGWWKSEEMQDEQVRVNSHKNANEGADSYASCTSEEEKV